MEVIKVLFLIKDKSLIGGVESYVYDFSDFLKKHNIEVSYLEIPNFIKFLSKNNFIREILSSVYFFYKIKFKFKDYIIISNGFGSEFIKNQFVIIHGTWPGFLLKNKEKGLLFKFKFFLRYLQLYMNLKGNKIISVKPICDFERKFDYFIPPFFKEEKNSMMFSYREYDCIMVGRDDPNKRLSYIKTIIENNIECLKDFKFMFIGLKNRITNHKNIILFNSLPRERVLTYISKSKYLLIASKYEGFPVVLKEAYLNNTKLIVTKDLFLTIFGKENLKFAERDKDFFIIANPDDKNFVKDLNYVLNLDDSEEVTHCFLKQIFMKSDLLKFLKDIKAEK